MEAPIVSNTQTVEVLIDSYSLENENEEFDEYVKNVLNKFIDSEETVFKFPSSLNTEQRHKIHVLCDSLDLKHTTSGTRYRVVTVSKKELNIHSPKRYKKLAKTLQSASNTPIPNNEHVLEVVNNQQNDNEKIKRKRGRPKKDTEEDVILPDAAAVNKYELRSRKNN